MLLLHGFLAKSRAVSAPKGASDDEDLRARAVLRGSAAAHALPAGDAGGLWEQQSYFSGRHRTDLDAWRTDGDAWAGRCDPYGDATTGGRLRAQRGRLYRRPRLLQRPVRERRRHALLVRVVLALIEEGPGASAISYMPRGGGRESFSAPMNENRRWI